MSPRRFENLNQPPVEKSLISNLIISYVAFFHALHVLGLSLIN